MPAIRVVLVRFFPRVFGSTQAASDQHYAKYGSRNPNPSKYGLGSKGGGGAKESNVGSQIGTGNNLGDITYTKTFEVESRERGRQSRDVRGMKWRDTDEVALVEMDDFSGKEVKVKSGNSSQVSL
jgi:hypothetical protein